MWGVCTYVVTMYPYGNCICKGIWNEMTKGSGAVSKFAATFCPPIDSLWGCLFLFSDHWPKHFLFAGFRGLSVYASQVQIIIQLSSTKPCSSHILHKLLLSSLSAAIFSQHMYTVVCIVTLHDYCIVGWVKVEGKSRGGVIEFHGREEGGVGAEEQRRLWQIDMWPLQILRPEM